MKVTCIALDEDSIKGLDELVRQRHYKNRSQAIREAIRTLLKKELIL